jgi:hypothetical protein
MKKMMLMIFIFAGVQDIQMNGAFFNHLTGAISINSKLKLNGLRSFSAFSVFKRSFASQTIPKPFNLQRIEIENPQISQLVNAIDAHNPKQVQDSLKAGTDWRNIPVYSQGGNAIAYAASRLKWTEDNGNFPVKRNLDKIMELLSDDLRKKHKNSQELTTACALGRTVAATT